MYLFYDEGGSIKYSCEAPYPIEGLTKQGKFTALYLDDSTNRHIIDDYANYTVIDGDPVYTPIPDSVKLPYLQESKIEEINIACNKDILNGFDSDVLGEYHHYKSDMEWQANFSEKANLLSLDSSITSVEWPTDGVMVEHTREQFIQLLMEKGSFISGKLSRYFAFKTQIMSETNLEVIKNITW